MTNESEKSTTPPDELLPLPKLLRAMIRDAEQWVPRARAQDFAAEVKAYARQNMQRLREERDGLLSRVRQLAANEKVLQRALNEGATPRATRAGAENPRLRAAGERVTAAFRAHGEARLPDEHLITRRECEHAILALDAALSSAQKEKGDSPLHEALVQYGLTAPKEPK